MRRVIRSRAVSGTAFLVAALGLVVAVYSRVQPFRYYGPFGAAAGLWNVRAGGLAFGIGMIVASASTLADAQRRSARPLHRLDWFFVLVGVVSSWALVAGFFEKGRAVPGWHVVCLSVLAVTACYVWATLLVRLRARTLGDTIFWPRVFRTLPLNQFSGVFILVVVVVASLLLLAGAQSTVQSAAQASSYFDISLSSWLGEWFTKVGLPGLTLAVVAVLCRNIIAITAAKEQAVEARLREERFRAELVTNVTHDIRTPLTSIVNYVDLIDKLGLEDPRLAEYTEVLGRKAERLKVLIGDLLDASRASAGNVPLRLEPIELTEIIGQIAGDFDDAFAARGLVWVGPAPGHHLVEADGEHLWRILENLVGNVVKYAQPGSCVHADLHRLPDLVRLRLSNRTTEPISATAEELMSQFVRADASRHSEGSGLGLFIADRLARLMGASLSVAVDGDRFTATVDLRAASAPPVPERPGTWEPAPTIALLDATRPIEVLEPTRPIEIEPTAVLVGDQEHREGRA